MTFLLFLKYGYLFFNTFTFRESALDCVLGTIRPCCTSNKAKRNNYLLKHTNVCTFLFFLKHFVQAMFINIGCRRRSSEWLFMSHFSHFLSIIFISILNLWEISFVYTIWNATVLMSFGVAPRNIPSSLLKYLNNSCTTSFENILT